MGLNSHDGILLEPFKQLDSASPLFRDCLNLRDTSNGAKGFHLRDFLHVSMPGGKYIG